MIHWQLFVYLLLSMKGSAHEAAQVIYIIAKLAAYKLLQKTKHSRQFLDARGIEQYAERDNMGAKSRHPPDYVLDNKEFLETRDARPLRILGEYLYPASVFRRQKITDTLVFFGSARICPPPALLKKGDLSQAKNKEAAASRIKDYSVYFSAALELAKELSLWSKTYRQATQRNLHIITGGGPGIMEAANRGAKEAGARSIGLNIRLPHEANANAYIAPELNFQFRYFFMRKYWFLYFARAFIVFPGGFGTLDELFEALTLQQTQHISAYIPIFLYGKDFWKTLINLPFLAQSGMISQEDLELIHIVDSVPEALEGLQKILVSP